MSATQTLARDLACVSCGYDLRGLEPEGRCPECATPVQRSLDAPLALWQTDRRWLRRVAAAPLMLLAALLLCNTYTPLSNFLSRLRLSDTIKIPAALAQLLATQLLCFLAAWRLAARIPMTPRDPPLLRSLLLIVAAACLAVYCAAIAALVLRHDDTWLTCGYIVLAMCVTPLIHFRLAQLARRDGRLWLARAHDIAVLVPVLTTIPLLRVGIDTMEDLREMSTTYFIFWRPLPGWGTVSNFQVFRLFNSDYSQVGSPEWWVGALCLIAIVWATVAILASAWMLIAAVRRGKNAASSAP